MCLCPFWLLSVSISDCHPSLSPSLLSLPFFFLLHLLHFFPLLSSLSVCVDFLYFLFFSVFHFHRGQSFLVGPSFFSLRPLSDIEVSFWQDINGKSDPYCTISVGSQQYNTEVIKRELNPKVIYRRWCVVVYCFRENKGDDWLLKMGEKKKEGNFARCFSSFFFLALQHIFWWPTSFFCRYADASYFVFIFQYFSFLSMSATFWLSHSPLFLLLFAVGRHVHVSSADGGSVATNLFVRLRQGM